MVIDACPSTVARAAKEATAAKTAAVLMFGNVGSGLGLESGCYEASVSEEGEGRLQEDFWRERVLIDLSNIHNFVSS